MNWLQKISQVNPTDIINLVMSGGNVTPAMMEALKQAGSSICGELNANIYMVSGMPRERLLEIQRIICRDEENVMDPNMNMQNVEQNAEPTPQSPEVTI